MSQDKVAISRLPVDVSICIRPYWETRRMSPVQADINSLLVGVSTCIRLCWETRYTILQMNNILRLLAPAAASIICIRRCSVVGRETTTTITKRKLPQEKVDCIHLCWEEAAGAVCARQFWEEPLRALAISSMMMKRMILMMRMIPIFCALHY